MTILDTWLHDTKINKLKHDKKKHEINTRIYQNYMNKKILIKIYIKPLTRHEKKHEHNVYTKCQSNKNQFNIENVGLTLAVQRRGKKWCSYDLTDNN